jgi:hypothetical protein
MQHERAKQQRKKRTDTNPDVTAVGQPTRKRRATSVPQQQDADTAQPPQPNEHIPAHTSLDTTAQTEPLQHTSVSAVRTTAAAQATNADAPMVDSKTPRPRTEGADDEIKFNTAARDKQLGRRTKQSSMPRTSHTKHTGKRSKHTQSAGKHSKKQLTDKKIDDNQMFEDLFFGSSDDDADNQLANSQGQASTDVPAYLSNAQRPVDSSACFCVSCGSAAARTWKFCFGCGAKLPYQATAQASLPHHGETTGHQTTRQANHDTAPAQPLGTPSAAPTTQGCSPGAVTLPATPSMQHHTTPATPIDVSALTPAQTQHAIDAVASTPKDAQQIKIKQAVIDYVDTNPNNERGTQRKFPVTFDVKHDYEEYQAWLYNLVDNEKSRKTYMGGLRQFLSMIECEAMPLKTCIGKIVVTGLVGRIFGLPIMSPKIPWTVKMLQVLSFVCRYLDFTGKLADDSNLVKHAAILKEQYIAPRQKLSGKARNTQLAVRDETDHAWVSNVPEADVIEAKVIEMMVDLATAARANELGKPGRRWSLYATISMTGIVFWAQCNSRPGPWAQLTTDTIKLMVKQKREYWVAIEGHKQLDVRGAHGAYMTPGSITAAEVYMQMSGRDGNEFWLHKAPKFDLLLKQACHIYMPGFSRMTPTSLRCMWTSKMHHDNGELAKAISSAKESINNCLDHSATVGDKHYAKGKAKKLAADSKACTQGFFGHLIEWPESLTSDANLDANEQLMIAKFGAGLDSFEKIAGAGEEDCDADAGDDDEPSPGHCDKASETSELICAADADAEAADLVENATETCAGALEHVAAVEDLDTRCCGSNRD